MTDSTCNIDVIKVNFHILRMGDELKINALDAYTSGHEKGAYPIKLRRERL